MQQHLPANFLWWNWFEQIWLDLGDIWVNLIRFWQNKNLASPKNSISYGHAKVSFISRQWQKLFLLRFLRHNVPEQNLQARCLQISAISFEKLFFKIISKFGKWLTFQVSRYGIPYFYFVIFNRFLVTCCGKVRNVQLIF